MTGFRFRLERVLEWRRAALEAAEGRFRQQAAAVAGLDRLSASLEASGLNNEVLIRQLPEVGGRDLEAFGAFRRRLHSRQAEVAAARVQAIAELAGRQAVTLEASRRVRLLERLRERRLAEWK